MTVFTRLPHFLVSVCALALAACAGDDATTEPAAPGADGGILACVGPTATELAAALALPATVECPICEGSLPPSVAMEDVNPASCAAGQTYTVGACDGRPTVVALLAAWCAFCQSQALRMEEIRAEFEQQGIEVNFVIINADNATEQIGELISRTRVPILQDLESIGAWDLFTGAKDDIYIYDAQLRLVDFLSPRGDKPYNLGNPEGYAYLVDAIERAVESSDSAAP